MYKSIVIAGALVASIATASAQSTTINNDGVATIVSQDQLGRFTSNDIDLATQNELNLIADGQSSNYDAITNIRRVVNQHDDALGGMGQLAQRITTLESRTVTNGVDGQDGQNGRDGIDGRNGVNGQDGRDGVDGINGQDGQDANTTPIHMGIAGNTALSTAFAGGDGIGFGIGANEYGSAAAIGVTKSFGRHSFSAGATSSRQASFGYKFKW